MRCGGAATDAVHDGRAGSGIGVCYFRVERLGKGVLKFGDKMRGATFDVWTYDKAGPRR